MKQKFRIKKALEGTLTIENYLNGYSVGFANPDGDGEELAKLMKSLKDGDELLIIKSN